MTPFVVLLLCLGPVVGSFLAVLVDRLPRGESVVRPRSACRSCGTVLGLRDLVPILSFAAARGRCRQCGAAIPPMLLYLELGGAGVAVLAVVAGGGPVQMGVSALFLWMLLALAVADLIWFRLPDPLTATLALAALGLAVLDHRLPDALIGAACGAGSFAALRFAYGRLRGREGLGLGDVKLMAGLGAWAGLALLPLLVLLAALTALAVALVGRWGSAQALDPARPLPFGAALCAATAALWLAGL